MLLPKEQLMRQPVFLAHLFLNCWWRYIGFFRTVQFPDIIWLGDVDWILLEVGLKRAC